MDFNTKSQLYCAPFIQEPSQLWMLNVDTKMTLTEIGGFQFPVTLNEKEYESSYVCSPYNALITYSQDELVKIKNRPLRLFLRILMWAIGGLLRHGKINKNRCINNFLLSTNPYPNWQGEGAEQQLKQDLAFYPDHAFVYRSLNYHTNHAVIHHLSQLGFIMTPSRQVYIFDSTLCDYKTRNNTQNDRRALAKSDYQLVTHDQIKKSDYPYILELYNKLYIEKYSQHNPQFSEQLIAYWHQNNLLTLFGLRDPKGVLQGIIGIFESEHVITAPLVGYNTHLPNQNALYRILIYLILDYSNKKGVCLNLSSGASHFKLLRGGQPFIEYSAIYIKHLPLYRRATWKGINWLLHTLFIPILKRYKL
ncbi:hypothetical protein [Legionella drancourtii]|uniref:BioF2-like acetyltransferase domain-containing protein n=1 Tax=Legionella drancourtii LLAP12 TaxID=658187 RepID=G9ENY6_9GAMM|nr:hypothetical protein [Legionella drancourtii]EHL31058.1 hypothetical protein LDG_6966 [Legionella drancourtii LLAP12]